MGLVELVHPSFRYELANFPTTGYWGQIILAFLMVGVVVLVIRQAIIGNILTKLVVGFVIIAIIFSGGSCVPGLAIIEYQPYNEYRRPPGQPGDGSFGGNRLISGTRVPGSESIGS